jgi:hypothetical protein
LEHIVLRNWTSPPLPSISHPRIKWVDLCDCKLDLPDWDDCFYVNYPWKLHSEKYRGLSGLSETLPALEGVRMLMQISHALSPCRVRSIPAGQTSMLIYGSNIPGYRFVASGGSYSVQCWI